MLLDIGIPYNLLPKKEGARKIVGPREGTPAPAEELPLTNHCSKKRGRVITWVSNCRKSRFYTGQNSIELPTSDRSKIKVG
jgi:hypothetical protein